METMFGIRRRHLTSPLAYILLGCVQFLVVLKLTTPGWDKRMYPSWNQLEQAKQEVLWDRSRKR